MPMSLVFRGGAVRFSFFLAAFGCQFFLVAFFVVFGSPFGNKFLIIQKKKKTTEDTKTKLTPTSREEPPNHYPAHSPGKGNQGPTEISPQPEQNHESAKRSTMAKNIKRKGPSLTHCFVHWIIHKLLKTRNS